MTGASPPLRGLRLAALLLGAGCAAPATPSLPADGPSPASSRSLLWQGHEAVADDRLEDAIRLYATARDRGIQPAFTTDLIAALEKRRTLGDVRPGSVHRVCVIWVRSVTTVHPSGERRVEPDVTEAQKRDWRLYFALMSRVIESFTDGGWSLAFSETDADDVHAWDDPHRPANADYLDLGEFFFDSADDCDSYLRMSNTISPARGLARRWPYVEGVLYGPDRGMVALNPGTHGFMVLLHEFFHDVEWVSGGLIRPAHGFRDAERSAFPGWTGDTEFDYYRWHFANTLPGEGREWQDLNHTGRWHADPRRSRRSLETIRAAYEGVPLAVRLEADSLASEAEELGRSDPRAARALWLRVLEMSPYHPRALQQVVASAGTDGTGPRAAGHADRLALLRSVSEVYEVPREAARLGRFAGGWRGWDLGEGGATTLEWEVTEQMREAGEYEVTLYYTHGRNALEIARVTLHEDGREVARDTHDGWSGSRLEGITYRLPLDAWTDGARYTIRAAVRGVGGTDSNGTVLLRRAGPGTGR